eukprot:gb/GECH01008268.1/.p1 GENE.gb/GECH01008268.1/~~gb/GECH01008268.1/.p1  ORF type:complete len:391 (+),score=107.29 gb/GECH01008268.1/:1-1173(+)
MDTNPSPASINTTPSISSPPPNRHLSPALVWSAAVQSSIYSSWNKDPQSIKRLRVKQLREELKIRGIDGSTLKKEELVDRLHALLQQEHTAREEMLHKLWEVHEQVLINAWNAAGSDLKRISPYTFFNAKNDIDTADDTAASVSQPDEGPVPVTELEFDDEEERDLLTEPLLPGKKSGEKRAADEEATGSPATKKTKKEKEKRAFRSRKKPTAAIQSKMEDLPSQHFLVLDRRFPAKPHCQEFTLVDDDDQRYDVTIDTVPSCSCSDYKINQDICIHILFVYRKILKMSSDNTAQWQRGLLSSELSDIFSSAPPDPKSSVVAKLVNEPSEEITIKQEEECPLCCENITQHHDTVFCRSRCGYPLHNRCFLRWKSLNTSSVKCPWCSVTWV